ncbi:MAG: hypothetical protein U0L67_04455 [Paludibacteraceae bacterium]|nr:hypothetical protein [Paludibacteraceae bacterium]
MKKLIGFFVFFFVAFSAGAVDVMITKDNRTIRGEVVEITDTEVKYRKEGSSVRFSTLKENFNLIVLQNGEVINFVSPATDDSELTSSSSLQLDSIYRVRRGAVSHFFQGENRISRREYEQITKAFCPDAYQMYAEGRRLYRSSKIVMGLSLGTLGVGMIVGLVYSGMERGNYSVAVPVSITAVGVIELCASAGMRQKGLKLEAESMELFNQRCLKETSAAVVPAIVVSDLGLGLALRF